MQLTAPPLKGSAIGFLCNPPRDLFMFSLFDAMIPMYSKYTRGDSTVCVHLARCVFERCCHKDSGVVGAGGWVGGCHGAQGLPLGT